MIQIDSIERPRFTLTGDKSPHFVEALKGFRGKWAELRENLILSSPTERVLTRHNLQLLDEVEQESRSYYRQKLDTHKVPGNPIENVRVVYMDEIPDDLKARLTIVKAAGVFLGEVDIVAVKVPSNEPEGILATARALHHELGHAAGTSEHRIAMGGRSPQRLGRNGFQRIVRNKVKGQAIEEGLVTLDELDFYRDYLSKVFPRHFTEEQAALIDDTYSSINGFYDISRQDFDTFISATGSDLASVEISAKSMQVASFVKHLARFFSPLVQEGDTDRLVGPRHLGRYVLDTARFNYDNRVVNVMKDTLSPKLADFILDIPAWPDGEKSHDMDAAGGLLQQLRAESLQS